MSSSPKFKITIQGVAPGYQPERVRAALERRFRLSPRQVEQLLANQAEPLLGLLDHQTAWNLKSRLHEVGVTCRITPVPLSNLADLDGRMSIQAQEPDRRPGQPPAVRRASRQAMPMRSGKAVTPASPSPSRPLMPAGLWRMAGVVVLAFLLGWYVRHSFQTPNQPVIMAEASR